MLEPWLSEVEIGVVSVHHGWREMDWKSVEGMLEELGARSWRVPPKIALLQNRWDGGEMLDWRPPYLGEWLSRGWTENRGFAAGCNAGVELLKDRRGHLPEWLLFTQADVEWEVSALLRAIQVSRGCGMVCGGDRPAVVGVSGGYLWGAEIREVGSQVNSRERRPIPVDFVTGFWVVMPSRVWREVKGWSEEYFLYYEDPDICLKAAARGYRSLVVPHLPVVHHRSHTVNRYLTNKLEIQAQSRALFLERWHEQEEVGAPAGVAVSSVDPGATGAGVARPRGRGRGVRASAKTCP